jgi:predicted transcriptional regulator
VVRLLVSQTITSHSFHERIGVSDYGSIRVLAYPELRLGRRGTRERAIDELERLSPNAPLKSASLNLLYNLSRNLEALSKKTQEDRNFIMRLAPLYQQDREQAVQQGVQQGLEQGRIQEANLVIRLLQRRFGEIPQNLEETIRKLPVERLEDLGLALLDFDTLTDLDNWLHP